MEMKVCTRCGPPAQPIENFAIRNRTRGIRQATCKTCQNKYGQAHYQAHREDYIKKARLRNAEQSRLNAEFLIDYLEHHPCVDAASREHLLVLLGLVMPYVNGRDVLEAVAADEELAARHAIIMVTGSVWAASTGRVAESRKQLDVPLVAKPFTFDDILPVMEELEQRWALATGDARDERNE